MSRIWAIARHMIAEGIRMKLALVFLGLIALIVLGLPFSITGDGSVTGAVQSFMQYALSGTGFLLALLTIFLSRSVADELVDRQIFLIMSKPVPRWQYIVGKWLGITLLNGAFLVAVGLTVYGMVHYIRYTRPPLDDRGMDKAELENEVLVARHAIRTKLPDFRTPAEQEFQRNLEEGVYDDRVNFSREEEIRRLVQKHEARWRVVGPYESRFFEFHNVLCDRSPENEVHIRYKTEVTNYPRDEIFRALWIVGDAAKGASVYRVPIRHVVGRYHTVRVPADAIAEDNTLLAMFRNENPFPGEPQYQNVIEFRKSDEVEVLFVVGSFGGNLVRLLILMQCKLMFLAAVAIMMTAVFSFPVACLGSFTIYVLAATRSFMEEALDFASDDFATMFSSVKEFVVQGIHLLTQLLYWIIPDFARYSAVEDLVNGRNVSLVWVLNGIVFLVLVKTAIVLGLAILCFYRREVAEVSV